MVKAALILITLWLPLGAAAAATCADQATDKKLAGAAKSSFLAKCEKDATATCETTATERKLAGAAKTSFVNKCKQDAIGEAH